MIEDLELFESDLVKRGYRLYRQCYRSSDFQYWKKFDGYQVGVVFYDFRPYGSGISYTLECLPKEDDRFDLTANDRSIEEFEKICEDFYQWAQKWKK